jgi:hypothetical protein
MRTSTAYFAGVGTVVVAIAAGIGGGLTLANIMSPSTSVHEASKLERQKSSESIRASNEPLQPVPYRPATRTSARAAPQPDRSQSEAANPSPPSEQIAAANPQDEPKPIVSAPASREAAAKPDAEQSDIAKLGATRSDTAKSAAAKSDAARPDEAFAKAREVEVRRAERRRAERRQQWAERGHQAPRVDRDLRDVEQKVREDSDARDVETQQVVVEPSRSAFPRIRLFESD